MDEKEKGAAEKRLLTKEELEKVVGGFVIGGKTYTTTVAAEDITFGSLAGGSYICGTDTIEGSNIFQLGNGTCLGVDAAGSSVYTVDNGKV